MEAAFSSLFRLIGAEMEKTKEKICCAPEDPQFLPHQIFDEEEEKQRGCEKTTAQAQAQTFEIWPKQESKGMNMKNSERQLEHKMTHLCFNNVLSVPYGDKGDKDMGKCETENDNAKRGQLDEDGFDKEDPTLQPTKQKLDPAAVAASAQAEAQLAPLVPADSAKERESDRQLAISNQPAVVKPKVDVTTANEESSSLLCAPDLPVVNAAGNQERNAEPKELITAVHKLEGELPSVQQSHSVGKAAQEEWSTPVAVTSWEKLRTCLTGLLSQASFHGEPGVLAVSNLKHHFLSSFNLELDEGKLGHSRTKSLVQDRRLRSICKLESRGKTQVLVQKNPSFERKESIGPRGDQEDFPSTMTTITTDVMSPKDDGSRGSELSINSKQLEGEARSPPQEYGEEPKTIAVPLDARAVESTDLSETDTIHPWCAPPRVGKASTPSLPSPYPTHHDGKQSVDTNGIFDHSHADGLDPIKKKENREERKNMTLPFVEKGASHVMYPNLLPAPPPRMMRDPNCIFGSSSGSPCSPISFAPAAKSPGLQAKKGRWGCLPCLEDILKASRKKSRTIGARLNGVAEQSSAIKGGDNDRSGSEVVEDEEGKCSSFNMKASQIAKHEREDDERAKRLTEELAKSKREKEVSELERQTLERETDELRQRLAALEATCSQSEETVSQLRAQLSEQEDLLREVLLSKPDQKATTSASGSTRRRNKQVVQAELEPGTTTFDRDQQRMQACQRWLRNVRGDGACMFRAIADQLGRHHLELRKICADYMQAHETFFAPYIADCFSAYIRRLRMPTTWGSDVELQALAVHLQFNVVVYRPALATTPEEMFATANQIINFDENTRCIELSYHIDYPTGEHYSSPRWADDDGTNRPTLATLSTIRARMP